MQYHEIETQFRYTGRSSVIGEHVRVQTEIWNLAVKGDELKLKGKKMRWAGRVLDFFLSFNCGDVGYRRYGNESRTKIIGEIECFLELLIEQREEGKRIRQLLGHIIIMI